MFSLDMRPAQDRAEWSSMKHLEDVDITGIFTEIQCEAEGRMSAITESIRGADALILDLEKKSSLDIEFAWRIRDLLRIEKALADLIATESRSRLQEIEIETLQTDSV